MSSVDNRIVEMQFNNKQFNNNAASSEKALQNVEKAIANTAKSKGMTEVDSQVKQVTASFSAMQVAGAAALGTIVSKATTAGISLVKKLTINPLMDGFREYQTGLDSIQTIMANTGKGVGQVNKALDQLNEYADQTIYNFGEMARNVGTFTAAGVDLKTSVASIKGIANLAALSGSSSQQASTAMYQLSQAIAAGKVGLQDWNSVVNAGMGGKQFQTALARTAQNMGELSTGAVTLEGNMKKLTINGESFRESISASGGGPSWLTSDVLVDTLKQISGGYSEAQLRAKGYNDEQVKQIVDLQKRAFDAATQIKTLPQLFGVIQESIGSTWAGVFRTIMGDFEQSKHLWSEAGFAIIGPNGFLTRAQNGLVSFIEDWAKLGGRQEVIKGFQRTYKSIYRILRALGQAWRDVFPASDTNILYRMSAGFNELTKKLRPTHDTVRALRDIFGGVFAVLHIGYTVVSAISRVFMGFISGLYDGTRTGQSGILDLFAAVGRLAMAFDDFLTNGLQVQKVLAEIGHVGGVLLSPLLKALGLVGEAFGALVRGEGFDGFLAPLKEAGGVVTDFFARIMGGLAQVTAPFERVSAFFTGIQSKLKGLSGGLPDVSGSFGGDKLEAAANQAKKGADAISGGFEKVAGAANKVKGSVDGLFRTFATGFGNGSGGEAAEGAQSLAEKAEEAGFSWENARGAIESVGNGIKSIFMKLGDVLQWIGKQFGDLFGGLDALEWAALINSAFTGGILYTIMNFANGFGNFGKAIREVLGTVGESIQTISGAVGDRAKAELIKAYAIAIGILAASLLILSFIDGKKLVKSIGAISTMMTLLVGSLYALSKIGATKGVLTLAGALTLVSAALINIAIAVAILGSQDYEKLAKGLGAMAVGLGLMVGAVFALSKVSGSIEGIAGSILILAFAMNVMAAAVLALGNMDMETLERGLGAMGVGLAILVAGMLALDEIKGEVKGLAASILILSIAMNVLAAAVLAFGNMDMKTLAIGFASIAAGLGIMVFALNSLAVGGKQAIAAAGAMVLMAGALNMLMSVILVLGNTPWQVLVTGILAFAAALVVLLAAGAIAGIPLVTAGLYALGITIGLLGAAMFLAGAGMLAFGTGFALMAAAGTAGVAVLVVAFQAFMAMLPQLGMQLAASFVAFLEVLAASAPKIRQAVVVIGANMLGVLTDLVPEFGKLIQALVDTGISILTKSIPQWVEMGFTVIDEFLASAAKHVPNIARSASKLIVDFIREVENHVEEIIDAGTDLIITFISGLGEASTEIATACGETILDILNGLDAAIVNYSGQIRNAGLRIAGHLLDGLTGGLASRGGKALGDLGGAIGDIFSRGGRGGPDIFTLARNAVNSAVSTVNASLADGNTKIRSAANVAKNAQGAASAAQVRANVADRAAAKANAKAEKAEARAAKKNASKASKKRARKLRANANRLENRATGAQSSAEAKQSAADKAAEALTWRINFEDADKQTRGQMLEDKANEYAVRAKQLLEKANAEAAAARKLRGKERQAMLKQAEKDAKAAKAWADKALEADEDSGDLYEEAVTDRIKALEAQKASDAKARADQEAYDKADTKTKSDMMLKRADASKKAAEDAEKAYAKNLADARKYAATDSEKAQRFLDAAEEQAKIAEDAYQREKSEREQSQQLLGQISTGGAQTGNPSITPSKSVLENAARSVDRWSETLAQATEMAQAGSSSTQFIQNNYSPEALPASVIYRQTKNLVATAETKMVAPN